VHSRDTDPGCVTEVAAEPTQRVFDGNASMVCCQRCLMICQCLDMQMQGLSLHGKFGRCAAEACVGAMWLDTSRHQCVPFPLVTAWRARVAGKSLRGVPYKPRRVLATRRIPVCIAAFVDVINLIIQHSSAFLVDTLQNSTTE
jgi:hypothetical protein